MDVTRFRSFAERYVIERASTFKADTEMQDAWSAVERAKSIYKHIENVAEVEARKDQKVAMPDKDHRQHRATQGNTGTVQALAQRVIAARRAMQSAQIAPAINSQSWTGRKGKGP
jgi:hypothetical protein